MGNVTEISPISYTVAPINSRLTNVEDKYVKSTRFIITSASSGAASLPANSTVVLDDFGGTVDAVVSAVSSGKPTYGTVFDASGNVVSTSFDSVGNYILSSIPSSYPVAIIYRVRQLLKDVDSASTDILTIPTLSVGSTGVVSATDVTYDNSISGLPATQVQSAIDELSGAAAVSASPGFTWGAPGTVNSGSYLLNDSVPSNLSGRIVPLTSGLITSTFVSLDNPATCSITIQKKSGVSFIDLITISLSSERIHIDNTQTASVAYGDEIAVKISSGSCDEPIVGIIIRGAV